MALDNRIIPKLGLLRIAFLCAKSDNYVIPF